MTTMMTITVNRETPQQALWARLDDTQRKKVAAVFRHMKKRAQEELSNILYIYMDCAYVPVFSPDELLLSAAFVFLTGYGMDDKQTWNIKPQELDRGMKQ